MAGNINMRIMEGYDHIISEKGNTYIALRKIQWTEEGPTKLDLRKYVTDTNGEEQIQKGVCFDDEAADELTKVLCETEYGKTKDIVSSIKNRDDFIPTIKKALSGQDISGLEEYTAGDIPVYDEEEYFDIRNEAEDILND